MASIENWQTFSNVAMFIGGLLLACGGYGSYHFTKLLEKERETLSSTTLINNFVSDTKRLLNPLDSQIKKIELFASSVDFDSQNLGFEIVHNLKKASSLIEKYDYNQLSNSFGEEKKSSSTTYCKKWHLLAP
jgi:hypothetical protein